VHMNDMMTGRCLCLCVELDTVFINGHFTCLNRLEQATQPTCTCACERVTFSDIAEFVVLLSICMLMTADTKMSLFQPNCCMKFFISRCFSATVYQTGPLHACRNTTQQALSTLLYSSASALSIPTYMEKFKK